MKTKLGLISCLVLQSSLSFAGVYNCFVMGLKENNSNVCNGTALRQCTQEKVDAAYEKREFKPTPSCVQVFQNCNGKYSELRFHIQNVLAEDENSARDVANKESFKAGGLVATSMAACNLEAGKEDDKAGEMKIDIVDKNFKFDFR